ncbi:hypothetical protein CH302_19510 [Rhodococcus sp. 15-2388-1-1a]|uniref:hypothetical protein n=1 Tax=Nocardiaceae TaxID=85025 RepID=UPI000562D8D9|nr:MULTISPECIES: hypothetical protein [Rhodococcus]OZE95129.1 hypothetical protein CH302_19510 [Rhodococcus sp. 15-2388-1-1a]
MTALPRRQLCKGCGYPIIFATTIPAGKTMPVDADPSESGTIVLHGTDPENIVATVLRKGQIAGARAAGQPLYESHFANCRDAATFRKTYR